MMTKKVTQDFHERTVRVWMHDCAYLRKQLGEERIKTAILEYRVRGLEKENERLTCSNCGLDLCESSSMCASCAEDKESA